LSAEEKCIILGDDLHYSGRRFALFWETICIILGDDLHYSGRHPIGENCLKLLSLLEFWARDDLPTVLRLFKTDRQQSENTSFAAAVFVEMKLQKPTVKTTKTPSMALTPLAENPGGDALTALRTETALSRFPLHRLTKGKTVQIELENQASAVLWRVDHNSRYGQPGALAYKLDSLFINRRIEEAGRPVPKIIRLGSLREIAEEVGSGNNTGTVKQALLQNATASITAKISYRTHSDGERWLEAVFNRYSVVFTGERLPHGEAADAVYLVLNDIYQEILNTAIFRPLDYDYMKSLPPIAQRFYEIVSYQIYAAVRHRNPRAKLLYSDYCLLSTATRYPDFDHIKKQMYKVLRPHIQSGYIAKVEYEALINERGEADYCLYLTPGPNAGREYEAFSGGGKLQKPLKARALKRAVAQTLELPFPPSPPLSLESLLDEGMAQEISPENIDREVAELIARLVSADLNRGDAERFAAQQPEVCRRQLDYLPFVEKFKTSRGAYLRRAIEGDFGPPAAWLRAQEQEEAQRGARAKRAQDLFQANQEKARQSHEKRFSGAYLGFLKERVGEVQDSHPGAYAAFVAWEGEQRAVYFKPPFAGRPMNERALEVFDREESHLERFVTFFRKKGAPLPTFWEWDEQLNPDALRP